MTLEQNLSPPSGVSRRFTLDNLDIRGQVVRLGEAWHTLLKGRTLAPHETEFLGELLCVAVLVGTGLKHPGRATLQIQRRASDPAPNQTRGSRLLVVDCTHTLGIRGMVRSEVIHDEAIDFAGWVDGSTLALTVSNTDSARQYQSIVPVSGLSIAECFEHYFDQSEQLPTHLWIHANADGAGALLLQKLPGADAKDADGWARVEHLAASVTAAELVGAPIAELLTNLFAEEDIRLYEPKPIHSAGGRDEEKVKTMLRSLGREELEATLAEQGELVINDEMCNQTYRFDAAAVAALFTADNNTKP